MPIPAIIAVTAATRAAAALAAKVAAKKAAKKVAKKAGNKAVFKSEAGKKLLKNASEKQKALNAKRKAEWWQSGMGKNDFREPMSSVKVIKGKGK